MAHSASITAVPLPSLSLYSSVVHLPRMASNLGRSSAKTTDSLGGFPYPFHTGMFFIVTPPLQKIRREVLSPRLLLINLKAEIWPASSCGCYPTVTQPRGGIHLRP